VLRGRRSVEPQVRAYPWAGRLLGALGEKLDALTAIRKTMVPDIADSASQFTKWLLINDTLLYGGPWMRCETSL